MVHSSFHFRTYYKTRGEKIDLRRMSQSFLTTTGDSPLVRAHLDRCSLNDLLNIDEKIKTPSCTYGDLCLFYAIYNSLRSVSERKAFRAWSHGQRPHEAFVLLIGHLLGRKFNVRHGYTANCVFFYLEYLKTHNYIVDFCWHKARASKKCSVMKLIHNCTVIKPFTKVSALVALMFSIL